MLSALTRDKAKRWRIIGVVSVISGLSLAGCASTQSAKPIKYYVSLGDSYSVGYQPYPTSGATSGFTGYVADKTGLVLKNFGCGGATTGSILHADGCHNVVAATDGVSYTTVPQAEAAESFIKDHKGSIGLITVSIGGNDVTSCAAAANPVTCVTEAVGVIRANVSALSTQLRSAAGSGVPIIGLTYPDVILGGWVYPAGTTDHTLASLSVVAFQTLINPALKAAYTGAGGQFVDVTAATGAYTPLSQLTTLAPYGTIPKAVAEVCMLTWYCSLGNIHAKTAGYTFIGKQITAEYARLQHP